MTRKWSGSERFLTQGRTGSLAETGSDLGARGSVDVIRKPDNGKAGFRWDQSMRDL